MKKVISLVSVFVLCLALVCGCGAKEVKLDDVLTQINSQYSLSLNTLDGVDKLNRYYNIDTNDVKQFAAEINQDNNAPIEIVLIEANDADSAKRVANALNSRYNSIYSQYSSYTPEKLDMVKGCKVTTDGNFVSLIVADDASAMLDIYNGAIK